METKVEQSVKNVFVVVNPVAGHAELQEILDLVEERFGQHGWNYNVYETTGKEDVAEIASEACRDGAELVIAAGGDGTVAGVINGLMNEGVPLGVIPVGTGNGLARALSIPLSVHEAMDLITGDHSLQSIDALKVGEQYYVLNVSVGISSRSMRNTSHEQKRRFGIAAYVWTVLNEVVGLKPRRFNLVADGHEVPVQATEILVSNGAILQKPLDLFGNKESFADGQVEANILMVRSILGYARLFWQLLRNPQGRKDELRKLTVRDRILIDAVGRPQPVQADGELIGKTPVEIQIVHKTLQVIVPPHSREA